MTFGVVPVKGLSTIHTQRFSTPHTAYETSAFHCHTCFAGSKLRLQSLSVLCPWCCVSCIYGSRCELTSYDKITTIMSTKLHRNPPFRAEHLGSLLRPEDLLKKRADVDKGVAEIGDLKPLEDDAVKEIVDLQIKLGFHPISDGEYRRHSKDLTRATFTHVVH